MKLIISFLDTSYSDEDTEKAPISNVETVFSHDAPLQYIKTRPLFSEGKGSLYLTGFVTHYCFLDPIIDLIEYRRRDSKKIFPYRRYAEVRYSVCKEPVFIVFNVFLIPSFYSCPLVFLIEANKRSSSVLL